MGVIREEFLLVDHFSSAFHELVSWGEQASGSLSEIAAHAKIAQEQLAMAGASNEIQTLTRQLDVQEQMIEQQGRATEALAAKRQQLVSLYGEESREAQKVAMQIAASQIKETNLWSAANRTEQKIVEQQIALEKATRSVEVMKEEEQRAAEAAGEIGQAAQSTDQEIQKAARSQGRVTNEMKKSSSEAKKLLSLIRQMVVASGAVKLTKAFLGFADQQAQIHARLGLMTDELESVEQLSDQIYQSAMRSRAAYSSTADAIAKMGLNAGNAFESNQELVAFMELVNKQFAIGGSGAAAMEGAMTQLTQAMSSGALRGEELNSILAAAPGIARNIEKYMGWAAGSIKQYAEAGEVTAQVVKYAMLEMADEINEQFNTMPMTLSQAMDLLQNEVQRSLQENASAWNDFINSADGQRVLVKMIALFSTLAEIGLGALSVMGQGAMFVMDNLDFILPILAAIGLALAIVKAESILAGAASVGSAILSGMAWAAAHLPILLLAVAFAGALVAAQQFGLGMQEVGGWVGETFGFIYAIGYNIFAALWNVIASFAEFFANVFNDPVSAVAHLFFDVFDAILGIVETVAGAIDALLGSDLSSAVSGFRGKMSGWVDETFGANAVEIKRMANLDVLGTSQTFGEKGAALGSKLENIGLNLEDISGSFGGFNLGDVPRAGVPEDIGKVGSVGSVKEVKGDVNLSDEDLKMYQDLAEQRYMNQIELKTMAPEIHVSIPERAGSNLSADDVAERIKVMLIQQMASQTSVSHG